MSGQRAHITVFDLLRHGLPMGTRIVAGKSGLHRPVTWTSVLHTRPPAFPSLEGRELALLSIDALQLLSDKLTLTDLVNDLAQMDVSAIGVIGKIDLSARQAADEHGIPLLSLPEGSAMRQIEYNVMRVLVGPPLPPEVRGQEIHEQLLQISTENRGMKDLITALADLTGRTLVVQDKRLDVVAACGPLTDDPDWPRIETVIGTEDPLPVLFRNRVEVAQAAPDPALIEMSDLGLKWLVLPIVANRMGRGFISMLIREGEAFEALDLQFIRHGAAVCAIEMAKEKAIREAQKRVQGGVIERLLLGTIPLDQTARQLTRLGHEPNNRQYSAMVACWAATPAPSDRRLETIFNEQVSAYGYDALVQLMEGSVVAFCAVEPPAGAGTLSYRKNMPRNVRQLAEAVAGRAPSSLVIGVGRPVETLSEWRASYQEAVAAQRVALQWHISPPLYFADLGVYRLLSLLLETDELRSFYHETLGELADDSHHNDEFIATLETFFEEHGNLSQTANRLHVHRNTLLYRMERIAQIGGFDMNNPETRLAVHLALKIRRLLTNPLRSTL